MSEAKRLSVRFYYYGDGSENGWEFPAKVRSMIAAVRIIRAFESAFKYERVVIYQHTKEWGLARPMFDGIIGQRTDASISKKRFLRAYPPKLLPDHELIQPVQGAGETV